ncbi:MAG: polysaccharide deacetylase family protein [Lachnospiraceae bacterium]|nr:polysaccharide deacetylase family protein [Lachnospiraceae bacterium]
MNKTLGTGSIDRSARVRRIKRVIIALIVIAILFPSVLCIILFAKLNKLEKQITELSYAKERVNVITESTKLYEPKKSNPLPTGTDSETISIEKIEKENTESIEVVDETATEPEIDTLYSLDEASESPDEKTNAPTENEEIALKRVYLTFDDGPSSNTSKILDILKEKNVEATFFVVGRLSDTTTPMYKRIVDEGHSIGMHSYTHKYDEIYKDTDSFIYDVEKIQLLIYEQTGIMSKLYRFPGGSSNTVSRTDINALAEELNKRDIKYFDWNVVSGDASSTYGLPKEEIVRRCTQGALAYENAVILMHDLPEKATTVEALPDIIDYFQSIGVEILPLDENSEQIHHTSELTE